MYVLGLVFFKSDGRIPCAHAIWHLFVAAAAGFHYYAILSHVFPETDLTNIPGNIWEIPKPLSKMLTSQVEL